MSNSLLKTIIYFLNILFLCFSIQVHAQIRLNGVGATFPAAIYMKWAQIYEKIANVQLNYQAIGSGAGIKQVTAGLVDFGASDKPLTAMELTKKGLIQFPAIIGAVVPVINLKGIQVNQLRLTGDLLANIYLGKITYWDDPALIKINTPIKLPHLPIHVIFRSDGSGTTFLFTHYLSQVNLIWNKEVGSETAVDWPVGIGAKGNQGMAAFIQKIPGSIGYLEYAYALQNHLITIQLNNTAGKYISPIFENFKAATINTKWQRENQFAEILTNQPGVNSWPIMGASFILIPTDAKNQRNMKAVLDFFAWAFKNGNNMAISLGYVPLPNQLANEIIRSWNRLRK